MTTWAQSWPLPTTSPILLTFQLRTWESTAMSSFILSQWLLLSFKRSTFPSMRCWFCRMKREGMISLKSSILEWSGSLYWKAILSSQGLRFVTRARIYDCWSSAISSWRNLRTSDRLDSRARRTYWMIRTFDNINLKWLQGTFSKAQPMTRMPASLTRRRSLWTRWTGPTNSKPRSISRKWSWLPSSLGFKDESPN